MDENDPIREPESLFKKIKDLFKNKKDKALGIHSPSKEMDYEVKRLCEEFNNSADAFRNFGISAEDACKRIERFSKILTPNEMRELIERRKQW